MTRQDIDPVAANSHAARATEIAERLIYVVPSDGSLAHEGDRVDLVELWNTLWQAKWLIAGVTGAVAAAALVYVLIATPWYRAEVLLAPADPKSTRGFPDELGGLGALGGLASLAGISIGGGNTAEPLAVLTSRNFTRAFIEDNNLIPILFAEDWDAAAGKWKAANADDWPDIQDAVKRFDEDILRVREDKKTKLVTLSIEWKDPRVAAEWANVLVQRLNDRMRHRSLEEAESNVSYLKRELTTANVVTLQQAVGRLLESELQKAMLARVNEEFSFRVIDRADAPKWRSHPKRAQTMAFAVIIGIAISVFLVLVRRTFRRHGGKVANPDRQGAPESLG